MAPHAADCPARGLMPPAPITSTDGRLPDALDACGGAAFLVVAALSWTSLTLAEVGAFSRPVFLLAASVVLGALIVWFRPLRTWARCRPDAVSVAWLAGLLLAGTAMLRQPPDPTIGGVDEDLYFHLGAIIEHRGGLVVTDPVLAATPPVEWPALFSRDDHWPRILNRFEGGLQARDGDPRLRPNFFHLTPAWIGAAAAIGGRGVAVYAVPVVAWLVPAALFLLTRRLVSVPAAMAASALLAVNPGYVWAGRLPLSEPFAAYLIVTGLVFASIWLSSRDTAAGRMAGMAVGLAALDRIDALLLVVPVLAVLLLVEWRRGPGSRVAAPALTLAVLVAQALAHALTISKPYTERLFRHVAHDRHLDSLLVVAGAFVLLAAAILLARRVRWRPPESWLNHAGTGLVLAALLWLVTRLGFGAATNHLTVLLTGPGLVLALAGLLVASRSSDRAMWLAIAVVVLSAAVFVEAPREVRAFPRVFRRDIPVLLPLMTLFQARALFPAWARRPHRLAAALVLMAVAGVQVNRLVTIYRRGSEASGGRQAVAAVAALLPPETVVIADSREADHLDLALDATGDRPTVGWRHPGGADAAPALRALADRALATDRPVAFLTTSPDEPLRLGTLAGLQFTPVGRASFYVERRTSTWPAAADTRLVDLAVYRLASRATLPWHPALGAADVGTVLGGWHAAEAFRPGRGRWTTEAATLQLPSFACTANSMPSTATLGFASIRPASIGQPLVVVSIERQEVFRVTPQDSGFHVYAFRLSDGLVHDLCGSPATLTISADAFVPARDAGLHDDRELGIAVSLLELGPSASAIAHE
jgi:4-amino-4-deoxy-L-arabinose transferase-like glycosyltransferase